MAEQDKGFSFRKLFIRDDVSTPEENKVVKPTEPLITQKPVDYTPYTIPPASLGVQDSSLVEDFVQRLQNLINQNNQTGFDFLEFTESLFEEKQNPDPEVYKMVFRIAQKIDKSLTPSRLLESAMYYKDLVQRTAESEASKGEAKKQGLQSEKEAEKNNLENGLKDIRSKIQILNQQIRDLQNQEIASTNQLAAIDQKYSNQFIDIDRKISAIRSAKDQVLSSIVDIEAGIKTNL